MICFGIVLALSTVASVVSSHTPTLREERNTLILKFENKLREIPSLLSDLRRAKELAPRIRDQILKIDLKSKNPGKQIREIMVPMKNRLHNLMDQFDRDFLRDQREWNADELQRRFVKSLDEVVQRYDEIEARITSGEQKIRGTLKELKDLNTFSPNAQKDLFKIIDKFTKLTGNAH
ncbi:uncharacterized protein LOC141856788 [Brevipalpus obovatus]|uniref:uncharacterized protein LOC141856788 n=1 Tax=Brevipalpus obovatus TaxID=246614 RepID=UPI003D9E36AE